MYIMHWNNTKDMWLTACYDVGTSQLTRLQLCAIYGNSCIHFGDIHWKFHVIRMLYTFTITSPKCSQVPVRILPANKCKFNRAKGLNQNTENWVPGLSCKCSDHWATTTRPLAYNTIYCQLRQNILVVAAHTEWLSGVYWSNQYHLYSIRGGLEELVVAWCSVVRYTVAQARDPGSIPSECWLLYFASYCKHVFNFCFTSPSLILRPLPHVWLLFSMQIKRRETWEIYADISWVASGRQRIDIEGWCQTVHSVPK